MLSAVLSTLQKIFSFTLVRSTHRTDAKAAPNPSLLDENLIPSADTQFRPPVVFLSRLCAALMHVDTKSALLQLKESFRSRQAGQAVRISLC